MTATGTIVQAASVRYRERAVPLSPLLLTESLIVYLGIIRALTRTVWPSDGGCGTMAEAVNAPFSKLPCLNSALI